ncbi:MAG TPA: hypothetical protein DCL41_02060 [Bdellovibrionales bacterium]|nr:hypothetical protein [Pseudobdellovibrionaceae bacterium]HAG90624.1 hypothetical protein [Bdellovibrionales bacterium]|tara:strand:- start:122 stop:631 length:510 start_codon:yes stop_codon:yes gene_type:complete
MWQILVITAFFTPSFGATAYKRALETKTNQYIEKGTIIGGTAGEGATLMKVRRKIHQKSGVERVVINLGNKKGNLIEGRTSFFQVNVEPGASRIVIHLAQVNHSELSEQELEKVFKNSPFVKTAKLIPDPEAASTNLVLGLKKQVKAEVIELSKKGTPGRIVLDLKQKG